MRVNEAETKRLLEAVKPAKLVAATKYITNLHFGLTILFKCNLLQNSYIEYKEIGTAKTAQ